MLKEVALELMKNKWVLDEFRKLWTHQTEYAPFYMTRTMWPQRERTWFPFEFDEESQVFYGKVLGDEDDRGSFSLAELCDINVEFHREQVEKSKMENWKTFFISKLEDRHEHILVWDKPFVVGRFGDDTVLTCDISRSKRSWLANAHLSRKRIESRELPDGTKYQTSTTRLYDVLRGTMIPGMPCSRSWNKKALKYTIDEWFKWAIDHFWQYFKVQIV